MTHQHNFPDSVDTACGDCGIMLSDYTQQIAAMNLALINAMEAIILTACPGTIPTHGDIVFCPRSVWDQIMDSIAEIQVRNSIH